MECAASQTLVFAVAKLVLPRNEAACQVHTWHGKSAQRSTPTDLPRPRLITCPTVEKPVIRTHYNLGTLFYRLLWGPHLHHGLWNADESPAVAARQLTEELARLASIDGREQVADIGCGMGGSSIWLAKNRDCQVTGVTISPVQRRWATASSAFHGTSMRTRFLCADAEELNLPAGSRDVVWSIECTEHLFNKAAFFDKARTWLKPGGRLAICAWLAGHDEAASETKKLCYDVCEGFFCPSLGTQADYEGWFRQAGLEVAHSELWTKRVLKTWEICRDRVRKTGVRQLARILGRNHVMFLDRFDAILEAYKTGAMEYGCFIARSPGLLLGT